MDNLDTLITLKDREMQLMPFPHVVIDNFLPEEFADEVYKSFPSFDYVKEHGREFSAVNENLKSQLTEESRFPPPFRKLGAALTSPAFMESLSELSKVEALIADEEWSGGGIHQTQPGGILDVHVDFNYVEQRKLYRRLNLILYLNKDWEQEWGGDIELWDKSVAKCEVSKSPIFNRCVIFETSEISYHGVTPVTCPPQETRKSFAAYFYTKDAPPHWEGRKHSTIFRTRPGEQSKKPAMAIESFKRSLRRRKIWLKRALGLAGPDAMTKR